MMLDKLLVPFTDKGKQVCLNFSGIDTGTENQDSEKNLGPMGTGSVTSANGTHSIACGHLKADYKSPATTVWARKWSAQLVEFGFPTRNGRTSELERGSGHKRRAGYKLSQMLSW